jgi:anti-sigma factor RsiW
MKNKKNKTCAGYEPLLQDYLDGELRGANREAVEVHLRECRACAHALAVARRGSALLSLANVGVDDPGPFFTHRVMAAVRAMSTDSELSFWRPLGFLAMRAAWTASIALAVVVAYGAVTTHQAPMQAALMHKTDVRSLESREPFADPFADPGAQTIRRDDFDVVFDTNER